MTSSVEATSKECPTSAGRKRLIENKPVNATDSIDYDAEPVTAVGSMPKKRFYRQRAHCNPLSHNNAFSYPCDGPDGMDWTADHFPNHPLLAIGREAKSIRPTVLDIGCGFGGLTVALSKILPNETVLGMEIRAKVTEYVRLRISALRSESDKGEYQNTSVMRTNSMKFLPFFFPGASVKKLFFCFPDPHFKRKNHPRRIISTRLLSEYAHILVDNGRLYAITDVEELHQWHVKMCDAHPSFERIEEKCDPCISAMVDSTEEGKKVARNKQSKYFCVYRRIPVQKCLELGGVNVEDFWNVTNFGVEWVSDNDVDRTENKN